MTSRVTKNMALVATLVAAGAFLWYFARVRPAQPDYLVNLAGIELAQGNPESALSVVKDLLTTYPDFEPALRVAALAHADLGNELEAARCFAAIPGNLQSALDFLAAGISRTIRSGHLSVAEGLLQYRIELDPEDVAAHRQLAALLNATGRRWDAIPHGLHCIRKQQFTLEELLLWSNPEEPFRDEQLLPQAARLAPDDPAVRMGLCLNRLQEGSDMTAPDEFRRCLDHSAASIEARAICGSWLLDQSDLTRAIAWNHDLPESAGEHSEIWYVRGRWSQLTGQPESAVRCFWESARRAPQSRKACFQLGQQLAALGRSEDAGPFLNRAQLLSEFQLTIRPLYFDGATAEQLLDVGRSLENMGRDVEASGWYFAAARLFPNHSAAAEQLSRLGFSGTGIAPELASFRDNPADRIDLSGLPLPNWDSPLQPAESSVSTVPDVRFSDVSETVGIQFEYFNSDDPTTPGKRIFETTGGGVAVFDLDHNGWPDLYFTQGCRWPPASGQQEFHDACFLNTGRGFFREMAGLAGLVAPEYGQGAATGDFDNDGFEDLYVAAIGGNQLFHNLGDGTFVRVSDPAIPGDDWTTSCLMADLNGDSFPDLFDANYLSDRSTWERGCGTDHPDECSPAAFTAAQSRIVINDAQGGWSDFTAGSDLAGIRGKALGVVTNRVPDSPVPDLMIANDGEANFFLVHECDTEGRLVRYRESAVFSGLAFDREGRAQGSMGIAAEDMDGDGASDFFVTNFSHESNTLYRQLPGQLFADVTRNAGLREPSLMKLGFGTQFLDADLDGWPDLVVANGHVVDRRHKGEEYSMAPQFFLNIGEGRFQELPPAGSPPYFAGQYLGRGLARLDWNRDGLEDFAVSHLESPAALVSNETAQHGQTLTVRLTGTRSSRDGIGASVTVHCGTRRQVRQLRAGDGYQASNERVLIFGLGAATQVDKLTVEWPSGVCDTIPDLPSGLTVHIVEGRGRGIRIPSR